MKVGVLAVPMPPFESFRTTFAAAEELGVDSFWVPDHLLGVANPTIWPDMTLGPLQPDSDAWFDPIVSIAALPAWRVPR